MASNAFKVAPDRLRKKPWSLTLQVWQFSPFSDPGFVRIGSPLAFCFALCPTRRIFGARRSRDDGAPLPRLLETILAAEGAFSSTAKRRDVTNPHARRDGTGNVWILPAFSSRCLFCFAHCAGQNETLTEPWRSCALNRRHRPGVVEGTRSEGCGFEGNEPLLSMHGQVLVFQFHR